MRKFVDAISFKKVHQKLRSFFVDSYEYKVNPSFGAVCPPTPEPQRRLFVNFSHFHVSKKVCKDLLTVHSVKIVKTTQGKTAKIAAPPSTPQDMTLKTKPVNFLAAIEIRTPVPSSPTLSLGH
jgi:hypothetical protein